VKCVDWHPQKGIIVSGSKDSQQPIKLWDPKTGQVMGGGGKVLDSHTVIVMPIRISLFMLILIVYGFCILC
jgi:polyadenylation factor subunit 2